MKKLIVILMTILFGCTTAQIKTTATDYAFSSNHPKLMVQIHKDVLNKGKKKDYWFWETVGNEGIVVRIVKSKTWMRGGYNYYSLEQILTNINYKRLDPVFINGHKWMKYAFVNENDFLHTGYFTRKDDHFIFVIRYVKLVEKYMQEVRKFQKSWVMSDEQKLLLKEAFKYTDELFTIKY